MNNENVETFRFNTMRPAHTIQKCRWSISNKDSRWVGFCLGEHGVSVSTEKWCWRTSVLKLWHFCIFSNLHLFQLVDRTATKVSINAFRSDLRIFVALIGTFETFKRKIHIFDTYGKLGIQKLWQQPNLSSSNDCQCYFFSESQSIHCIEFNLDSYGAPHPLRSNQEVDLIWSSACLQLNLWLAKFLEVIYKNKTMNQITGATISNVLIDDLMLWLSNEYLPSPK